MRGAWRKYRWWFGAGFALMLLGLGVLKFTDKPLRGADISFMRGLPRYMQHAVIAEQADTLPGVPATPSAEAPERIIVPDAPGAVPSGGGQKRDDAAGTIERISREGDDAPDAAAAPLPDTGRRGDEQEETRKRQERRWKAKKLQLNFDFDVSAGQAGPGSRSATGGIPDPRD